MNLLNNLTIKNLKLNKKRTIVTIIGIMLSVALITAVATIYSSLIKSLIDFETYQKGNFHAAFFDVPINEIETIKKLEIPTIFLTAKDDEETVVKGLTIGAEDYITKPFSTKELLARINKILIRFKKQSIISIKNIRFDMDKMVVYKDGKKVNLTSLELKLLNLLFMNLNKVVSRNTIFDTIWEATGNDVDDHTITVYFKRIREKLGTDIIITVKGIGYRIDNEK